MFWLYHVVSLSLHLFLAEGNQIRSNEERGVRGQRGEQQLEQIRSPTLEVFMHLPPHFRQLRSFRDSLEIKPEKIKGSADRWKRDANREGIVDVRSYEIARPATFKKNVPRAKREAEPSEEGKTTPIVDNPEPEKLVGAGEREKSPEAHALRGPIYSNYPVKEFDIMDVDDPDDPRRRRNDSSDGPDDNSQRDKRTFMDEENGETTTPVPFWKRKKESPPFITGRGTSAQKTNSYTPAQHRSGESARESHSLNLDKTVQSNEISRSNQDNYYAATNRRTYSRQSDHPASSTPKSVYDTIDYTGKKNQESGRSYEEKKETLREGRVSATHEQYNRQHPFAPWPYDRPYYQPPYPYPTEVLGRGVEYYHRTYDPATGRIVYYANMPENGRSYDYRYMDPVNRNFYVNNRPYFYDPYYRNYVPPPPPFDYRFGSGVGRMDYMRSGRSSPQGFSYPFQEREKFPRDARFNGAFERGGRPKDELRNKTYIIYDAEENRSQFSRPQYPPDANRLGFTPAPSNPTPPQVPFRQFPFTPSGDYFPPAAFPFRNQFFPSGSGGSLWGQNQRPGPGVTDSNLNSRPLNSPEVQLPLTVPNRDLDKSKKS